MATFSENVQTGNDNGWKSGSWSANTGSTSVGKNAGGVIQTSGYRFSGVTIPQGATITAATLRVTGYLNDSVNVSGQLKGIAEDNTADFTSDPTGRTRTTNYLNWNFPTGVTLDTNYTSSDISAIVQEIVNRGGWSSGNAMGFIFDDNGSSTSNVVDFYGYVSSATKCAYISITYSTATTTSTTTTSTSTTTTSTSTTTFPISIEHHGIKTYTQNPSGGLTSPKNILLNSHNTILKIHKHNSFSMTITKVSVEKTLTISFPELNYRPVVLVYCQRLSHDTPPVLDTRYHLLDWSYYGATKFGYNYVEIYNNQIIIKFYDDLVDPNGGSYTLLGHYYIFKEEAINQ